MNTLRPVAAVLVRIQIPLLLAACASPGARSPSPFQNWMSDPIPVVVENHGFYDVNVYVERDGVRFRLGSVGGCATGRFLVKRSLVGAVGPYHLVANYIGRRESLKTHAIEVIPGGTTIWRLEQSDWASSVEIR